jgi:hypothetical protein
MSEKKTNLMFGHEVIMEKDFEQKIDVNRNRDSRDSGRPSVFNYRQIQKFGELYSQIERTNMIEQQIHDLEVVKEELKKTTQELKEYKEKTQKLEFNMSKIMSILNIELK